MLDDQVDRIILRWIAQNEREDDRLEFKLRIELTTARSRAEFIRDVIALANSSGEHGERDAYLVIGYRDGEFRDVAPEHYDGATFGQILREFVAPQVQTEYKEFPNQRGGNLGVVVVRQDPDVLHLVKKQLRDGERVLLCPGQSWIRHSSGKCPLDGDEICSRFTTIAERMTGIATEPLHRIITELESVQGAVLQPVS